MPVEAITSSHIDRTLDTIQPFQVDLQNVTNTSLYLTSLRIIKHETEIFHGGTSSETYIKEDNIAVSISIMQVNAIETLWELYIAGLLSKSRVHHETHGFFKSLAVIEVVITVDVQKICTIG